MSKVLAKFAISGVTSRRSVEYDYEMGSPTYRQVVSAGEVSEVSLHAVKGEPFGKATPQGAVTMLIMNPAAAAIFREAWEGYVKSDDPNVKAPEFYVTFKLDDGTGSE